MLTIQSQQMSLFYKIPIWFLWGNRLFFHCFVCFNTTDWSYTWSTHTCM